MYDKTGKRDHIDAWCEGAVHLWLQVAIVWKIFDTQQELHNNVTDAGLPDS